MSNLFSSPIKLFIGDERKWDVMSHFSSFVPPAVKPKQNIFVVIGIKLKSGSQLTQNPLQTL